MLFRSSVTNQPIEHTKADRNILELFNKRKQVIDESKNLKITKKELLAMIFCPQKFISKKTIYLSNVLDKSNQSISKLLDLSAFMKQNNDIKVLKMVTLNKAQFELCNFIKKEEYTRERMTNQHREQNLIMMCDYFRKKRIEGFSEIGRAHV